MNLTVAIVAGGLAVVCLGVVYRLLPSRTPSQKKPVIAVFPKYTFPYRSIETLHEQLALQGFKQSAENIYVRGNVLGDFMANWVKLKISIDQNKQVATLQSGVLGIAFDTGDLWEIVQTLRGETN